jgi:hypothetical protein
VLTEESLIAIAKFSKRCYRKQYHAGYTVPYNGTVLYDSLISANGAVEVLVELIPLLMTIKRQQSTGTLVALIANLYRKTQPSNQRILKTVGQMRSYIPQPT